MRRTGRRRAIGVAVIAAAGLVAVACGDDAARHDGSDAADASPPTAAPGASGAPSTPEPARRAATARTLTPAELDALFDAWRKACDGGLDTDPADTRRAADAILAAGRPALDRVLAGLEGNGDDWDFRDEELIRAFGAEAVLPLVALLGSESEFARVRAMALIRDMSAAWAFSDKGPAVCRALIARLDDPNSDAHSALMQSRPAGRAVAKDIAALWAKATGRQREQLAEVLVALGSDAADAEPILREVLAAARGKPGEPLSEDDADEASMRAAEAIQILAVLRAGDASFVDPLRKLLAEGPPDARTGVLKMLAACGESAAPAAREIAALLHDDATREAAALALLAMPSVADAVMLDLIRAENPEQALTTFAKDPAFAARLARALPGLAGPEIPVAYLALAYAETFDMKTLAAALLRHPLPEARELALYPWEAGAEEPLPPGALDLLDDPAPSVRAHAAAVLVSRDEMPLERILAVALAARSAADSNVRIDALDALGLLASEFPKALDALLEALSDPDQFVRRTAARELSTSASADDPRVLAGLLRALSDPEPWVRDGAFSYLESGSEPIRGDHAALVTELVQRLVDEGNRSSMTDPVTVVLRFEGGHAALIDGLGRALASDPEEHHWDVDHALELVEIAGPRAAALRPALVRMQQAGDARFTLDIEKALAAIDAPPPGAAADPEAIARGEGDIDSKVARLLELGEPGRRAIVTLAGDEDVNEAALLELLAAVPLADVIADAARATGDGSGPRRRGAAALASLLPDKDAIALLDALSPAGEDSSDVVVRSLCRVEERSPGSVPGSLAARLLRDGEDKRDWTALPLAELLGARVTAIDRDVIPELRALRDTSHFGNRCAAAIALWRITGVQDEALPTLRSVLAHPERIGTAGESDVPWRRIGAALQEMKLADEDIAAVVATLRAASAYEPSDDDDGGLQASENVAGAIEPLCAVIEKLGPRGAPAVPALRVALGHWGGWPAGIIRALGAIGPAASAAVPDVRRWIASSGDEEGVGREALARILAKPR